MVTFQIHLEAIEPVGFGLWVWSVCPTQAMPVLDGFLPCVRPTPAGRNACGLNPYKASDEERIWPP